MSKIGKQPITVPEGVQVEQSKGHIKITGPKGILERSFPLQIQVNEEGHILKVKSDNSTLWGTWRAHIANMVIGVSVGFEKKLEIQGIGYRVALQGQSLVFQLGFSHPVTVPILEGLSCEVKENVVTVKGVNKEEVGQFSAYLRSLRPPDAYKGKGIRYLGEVIKLKPGKKAGVGVTA